MPDEATEFRRLADALREAFRELADLPLAAERRAELTRRLLAVTAAAKHDVTGARARLDELLAEIRAQAADRPPS